MQRTILAALIGSLFTLPATAQNTPSLEEIVVTATRTARTTDDSLAAVSVITRPEIERLQAHSVTDLLAGLTGLHFANGGGTGKTTSIYLRGTEPSHVVLLIDGIRLGSATLGTASFQDLPVSQIERIEIVRGPMSSLYGADAIGGVIQIFTQKGKGLPTPSASLMGGRDNTRQLQAGISGGGTRGWFNLNASHFNTDGFSAQRGSETDDDGYRNTSLTLRGGLTLNASTSLEAQVMRTEGKNHYDGSYVNEGTTAQQILSTTLKHRLSDRWHSHLTLGESRDEADDFLNGVYVDTYNTRRRLATWQNDLELDTLGLLSLGIDHQKDSVVSSDSYATSQRNDTGLFGQWLVHAGRHAYKLSLRRDHNSQFGHATTGNVAWGTALSEQVQTRLSYGTAFKAPTFNDLYYPFSGNPDLQPEKSRTLEWGVTGQYGDTRWNLNAFSTRVTDLIAWACVSNCSDADWSNDLWQPSNLNQARIRGLEAESRFRLGRWQSRLSATLLSPEDARTGKQLPHRARQSLRLDLDRTWGVWRIGTTVRAESARYDDTANSTRLGGYGLLDLRAEYPLSHELTLAGRVENLFGQHYETAAGYNQPGTGLYITLRWHPGQ